MTTLLHLSCKHAKKESLSRVYIFAMDHYQSLSRSLKIFQRLSYISSLTVSSGRYGPWECHTSDYIIQSKIHFGSDE